MALKTRQSEVIKNKFLEFLLDKYRLGQKVIGYGAAAKANTLINYAGVKPDLLMCIIDNSKLKTERYTPGSHIPVVSSSYLSSFDSPQNIVIFPWNIQDEILRLIPDMHNVYVVFPEIKKLR